MKITSVRPWLIKSDASYWGEFLFVEVSTDEGITGWGEITTTTKIANRALTAMLRQISSTMIGEDPAHIERLWHKLFRSFTYMGSRGAAVECLSAIDIALWDIRGKALGKPIYELLGGPVRDEIALYTHPDQRKFTSKEAVVAEIQAIVKSGHTALKFDPFPQQGPYVDGIAREQRDGYLDGSMTRQGRARGRGVDGADPGNSRASDRNSYRRAWPLRRANGHPALPLPRGGRKHRLVRGAMPTGKRQRPQAGAREGQRCQSRGASADIRSGTSSPFSRTSWPTTSCPT